MLRFVLFGQSVAVSNYLAQAEVIFEYRSSDASGPAQERLEFRAGFFAWYDQLWDRINLRNDRQHFQEGPFVLDILTCDERAVREAVLNAISHRNYQLGSSVFIRQYSNRIEFSSPGGLPVEVGIEKYLHRQRRGIGALPRSSRNADWSNSPGKA